MSDHIECPNCGDLELRSVNEYREGDVIWTEFECGRCKHYEQMSRKAEYSEV